MTYNDFLHEIQHKGSKPHHISHCYGTRDAWKWVRTNKWRALNGNRCPSSLYAKIINKVNKLIIENIFKGHIVTLPYSMGTLKLIATPSKVEFKDNRIKDNYRTDWKKTLQYWHEDENARKMRIRIKRVQDYIYSISYSKLKSNYRNQKYYEMRFNRSLIRLLGEKIDNQKLNASIY